MTEMTIRVYRINAAGKVVEDSGVKEYSANGDIPVSMKFPPCECPGHRRLVHDVMRVGQ
ncbi:hypothetical protein AB0P05_26435 [Streptomyces flaveolus]|uniref:hypothetical protein n=1 Tax=Streptomyces flaveolus TaxID=67297 RepID=UPI00341A4333